MTSEADEFLSTDPLPQISYAVAYFILPQYAFHRLNKVEELFQSNSRTAGPFFYALGCQLRKAAPTRHDAELFALRAGTLDDQTDFYVMSYPNPPPVDFSSFDPGAIKRRTLAPYFSGIFRNRDTQKVSYFVLAQAPLGGGTTLRSVTVDPMVNSNLGEGPEPDLDAFLASAAFRLEMA